MGKEVDLADDAPIEHQDAVALTGAHQVLRFERAQRLAQGVAIGAELERQFAFRRQPGARLIATEQDLAPQLLHRRLAARAPRRRRKFDWFNHLNEWLNQSRLAVNPSFHY